MYLRGIDLYALRECNMYNGYAVQRISVPGLSSVLVADGRTSGYLELGWGGKGGRKTTINFTFITERPERSEIEREVKGILEDLL